MRFSSPCGLCEHGCDLRKSNPLILQEIVHDSRLYHGHELKAGQSRYNAYGNFRVREHG